MPTSDPLKLSLLCCINPRCAVTWLKEQISFASGNSPVVFISAKKAEKTTETPHSTPAPIRVRKLSEFSNWPMNLQAKETGNLPLWIKPMFWRVRVFGGKWHRNWHLSIQTLRPTICSLTMQPCRSSNGQRNSMYW